jgi:NitT/TauT family transport system permease protein
MAIAEPSAPVDLAPAARAGAGLGLSLGRKVGLPLGFALASVVGWELVCRLGDISPVLLAPPSAVWQVLATNHAILIEQAIPTTVETVVGFALATVLGVVLGIAITVSAKVREALYPHIVLFQLIPKIALAPLFIVWLGIGSPSRLTFAVFIAFFPIVVSTAAGLVSAKPDAVRLCRALTASEAQIFRMVRFPFAVPYIFAGMKIGVTMAMIGVIVGEFITAQAGLGYIIMFGSSAAETALVLAAIVLLCVIGLVLYGAVALAELAMKRWYGAEIPAGGFV